MDNIWSFYESMPTVTRTYITACVLTTLGVQLDIISPFQLYFNLKLIFSQYQYWRLITTFLYFGTFGFSFMFNILFTYRYCRMLEEGSFRSNTADFFFMFLFGGSVMICIAPFVKLLFLGHAFTLFLVYVWAKRNVQIQLSLFGLFNFRAPHLPWVLLFFSLILGNSVLTDVLGIATGHIYYYLEDVFPHLPGGFRVLKTPKILVYLFNPAEYSLNRLNEENLARPETENLNTLNQTTNQTNNQINNNQTEENNTLNTTINRTEETANQINNETNNNNSINRDNQSNLNKERLGSNNLNSNLDNTTNQNNQTTQSNNQHDHLD